MEQSEKAIKKIPKETVIVEDANIIKRWMASTIQHAFTFFFKGNVDLKEKEKKILYWEIMGVEPKSRCSITAQTIIVISSNTMIIILGRW